MRRLARWLNYLEDGLIVLILFMMIGLAVYQIILRNLFSSSLVWVEPLLQNAVLWVGLLGAMIASRRDEHIRIDLINNRLTPAARRWSGSSPASPCCGSPAGSASARIASSSCWSPWWCWRWAPRGASTCRWW